MDKKIKIAEKPDPKIHLPQGKSTAISVFDTVLRAHTFQSKRCVMPVTVERTMKVTGENVNIEYTHTEIHEYVKYNIGEN